MKEVLSVMTIEHSDIKKAAPVMKHWASDTKDEPSVMTEGLSVMKNRVIVMTNDPSEMKNEPSVMTEGLSEMKNGLPEATEGLPEMTEASTDMREGQSESMVGPYVDKLSLVEPQGRSQSIRRHSPNLSQHRPRQTVAGLTATRRARDLPASWRGSP